VVEAIHVSKRTQTWITDVARGIEENTDAATCARILESCGRSCAPASLIAKAKAIYKTSAGIPEFLSRLGEVFDALQIADDAVYVVYPRCYCAQIEGVPMDKVPDAYCNCSVGWIREVFEQTLGHPIRVERIKTVVSGGDECRFRVIL